MTAPEIIAALNSALYCDKRSEEQIAKDAKIGINVIRYFRNNKNIRLDTLIRICGQVGLVVEVREKTGRKEGK